MTGNNTELMSYLDSAVSPYHAVSQAAAMLDAAGFSPLEMTGNWTLEAGHSYYVNMFDSSLLAFRTGSIEGGIRLSGAHTDWPCLRVRPNPELVSAGCCKLSVEVYGGALLNTWFDRPLSLAGLVMLRSDDPLHPRHVLVDFAEPVITVPSLAIHMNRGVNSGVEVNALRDMPPICRTIEAAWEKNGYLAGKIAENLGVEPSDVLSFDLVAYNTQPATLVGFEKDMLSSPRLDNLTSCFACLYGIIQAQTDAFCGIVLYDNEEIGSRTKQGAGSSVLSMLLEKACGSLGIGRGEYLDAMMDGILLSCDVAHAAHPNYAEKSDSISRSLLNHGLSLKLNASQKYATDAAGWAIVEGLCLKNDIPHQKYANRPDMAGGGTIGSIASALMGIRAVDVGVPMLAMHSSCELMGAKDQQALNALVKALFEA